MRTRGDAFRFSGWLELAAWGNLRHMRSAWWRVEERLLEAKIANRGTRERLTEVIRVSADAPS